MCCTTSGQRYVNQHLRSCKFKYEDIRTAADLFQRGDWFFKFDYTSGYNHVEIFQAHTKFLGCSWIVDDSHKFFKFTVLPFGLSVGPFIFTKIQKALTKHLCGSAWHGSQLCVRTTITVFVIAVIV